MGNVQSAGQESSQLAGHLVKRHGFQILRVHPNSPVSEVQIFPYFDYIIAINGVIVTQDLPNIIGEMAKNHVNKPLQLTLYNSRRDEQRDVTIVPRTGWGGDGLLGCAIRFCPLDGVRDRVWHILNVHSNSPAEKAGLKAQSDYIIASPDFVIRSESDFYEIITHNTKKAVKLIVFNAESNNIRQIEIVPDFDWGGEGCVGCDIGAGMLHWVPPEGKTLIAASAPAGNVPAAAPIISVTAAEPVDLLQPVQPIQPVQQEQPPVEHAQVPSPIQPVQPIPPALTAQPVQVVVQASETAAPVQPTQPVPSTQPSQPLQSTQPIQPLRPPLPVPSNQSALPIQPPMPTVQPIAVAVPSSRPVFDNLSTSPVTHSVAPTQPVPMGPPITQHPPQIPQSPVVPHNPSPRPAQPQSPVISTAGFVIDDIPQPNFTVTSEMFTNTQQQ